MTDLSQMSVKEIVEHLSSAVNPATVQGIEAVVQLRLTGDEGGEWILALKDGQLTVNEGVAESPRVTLTAKADDFKKVVTGKTNATQAFMLGKIKITGDMGFAMKLVNLFK